MIASRPAITNNMPLENDGDMAVAYVMPDRNDHPIPGTPCLRAGGCDNQRQRTLCRQRARWGTGGGDVNAADFLGDALRRGRYRGGPKSPILCLMG